MTSALQITDDHEADGRPRLTAVGEIDLSNAIEFADRLAAAVGSGGGRVVVDLTAVDYLDSAALAALFAQADHIDIRISPLNESLLTFSGLADLTNVQVIPSAAGDEASAAS